MPVAMKARSPPCNSVVAVNPLRPNRAGSHADGKVRERLAVPSRGIAQPISLWPWCSGSTVTEVSMKPRNPSGPTGMPVSGLPAM